MRAIEASISRLTLREISRGNHTRRISLNLLAAIVAGMVLGITANRQTTIPIEADAFRAGSMSVQAIQPAIQIEQGPQTGAYELRF